MSTEQKSSKLSYIKVPEFAAGNVKINIEARHAKNFKSAILFIRFGLKDTKSDIASVINGLIQQYARTHDTGIGISAKTNIIKIIPGIQSIYIMTDEHHILPNIKLFYKYVNEKKIDGQSPIIRSACMYEAIKDAITSINVIVYGKCASFIKKFANKQDKSDRLSPIKSLETGLVVNKTAAGVINIYAKDCPTLCIGTQDTQVRLMVSVILADIPFTFSAANIQFNSQTDLETARELLRDRKTNIIILKRFVEQMKPEFDKDVPTNEFIERFRMFARIMFNLKGTNNDCSAETVKLFIDACKGRTNTSLTALSKL
jgi:hypothetical protein